MPPIPATTDAIAARSMAVAGVPVDMAAVSFRY
jgi:hypothetical protein